MYPTSTSKVISLTAAFETDTQPITHRRLWRYITAFALTALVILCCATLQQGKTIIHASSSSGSKHHFYKRSIDTSGLDVQTRDIGDKNEQSIYANLVPMISITDDPFFDKANIRRLFVIGDVHGCIKEFNALLTKIEYNYKRGDRIILLGDLVQKGPDSVGVIRRAKEVKALCVRGNHDDVLVRIMGYLQDHKFPVADTKNNQEVMPEGPVVDPIQFSLPHWEIARNMTKTDYEYLSSCPLVLGIPALNALFVHAGVDPRKPLLDQKPHLVMTMRSILFDGTPTEERGPLNWSDEWNLFQSTHISAVESTYTDVYYGHDSVSGLQIKTNTFGLDSACVFGGMLSALELKSGQHTQVPCETYAQHPDSE